MDEIWKDVPFYEGLYKASNTGKVKSLERTVYRRSCKMVLKEKIIGLKTKGDYLYTALTKDGMSKMISVHCIISMTFLDHHSDGYKLVVDHIDNNKLNNSVSNLQVITQRKNVSKRVNVLKTSKYVGVSWNKYNCKWRASIRINGKTKYLGYFSNEEEASDAYQKSLKNL